MKLQMKTRFLLLLLVLSSSLAFGQAGALSTPRSVQSVVNGTMRPVANATITVCAASTGGIPCSPALSGAVFKDAALAQPLSNPFTTDSNGNYQFAAVPGTYTVTETGTGFKGYSYQYQAVIGSGSGSSVNVLGVSVPVESFGAIGDWNGSTGTDNTTAIQNCLNSLTSGVCFLQAKAYKVSGTLTISKSSVGIVGVSTANQETHDFTAAPVASVIISTSASADILDVAGSSPAGGNIGYNIFKNFTLSRAVAPSGTARGFSLVNSLGADVESIHSNDSIQNFYFKAVGSGGVGRVENCAATWGYNSVTETTGNLYGFFVDSSGAVGSPSLRLRNNVVANNLGNPGGGLTTYGLVATGSLPSDLHVDHMETALLNYGLYINSSGSPSTDIHIVDSVFDSCYTSCISINGISSLGSVTVLGGWSELLASSSSPAVDIESSNNVKIMGHDVFAASTVGTVFTAHTGSDIQLIGNTVYATASSAIVFNGITSGQIESNSILGATATTLINVIASVDAAIGSNSLEGAATNGIVLDSSSHRISGLETNTCGTAGGTITNCLVDSGGNGLQLPAQVFANYPACTAALKGKLVVVTDSNTATYNATVAGAGSNVIPMLCNGTSWVAH
jgi:hypothetical protein